MRTLCLLLLFCLLLAGPVAAASVNMSAAPPVAKVIATPVTVVSPALQRTLVYQPPVVTPLPPGTLEIVSEPSGATVSVDGVVKGTTPFSKEVLAGTRTVNVTLAGYRAYSSRAEIPASGLLSVTIALERLSLKQVSRDETPVPLTFAQSGPNQNLSQVSPRPTFAAAREVLTAGINNGSQSPDEANTNMCLSGQKCLAIFEAAEQYPQGGYYYLVDGPACGHVTLSNGTAIPRYCISVPANSGIQPGRVPAMVTIPAAQQVNAVNATGPNGMQTIVTPRVLGGKKQAGTFDSLLGFFNGMFGGPVCLTGQTECDNTCVDLMTDSSHCGACDYFCFEPGVCSGGECVDPNASLWTAPIPL